MSTDAIRKQARALMWLVTVPFAAFALALTVLLANVIVQGGRYVDGVLIYYLPMALYLWAMWMIRSALKAIATDGLFDPIVPRLLFRVGLALFGGAVFTVVGVPLMTAVVWGHAYLRTFEPSPIVLGVIGAVLILLSRLFDRAGEIHDEIGEFF